MPVYPGALGSRSFLVLLAEFFGCPRTNCPLDALLPRSSQYPCPRVLHDFMQALLLEIERAQPHPIRLDRTAGVRVRKRPEVSSGTALAVTVLPEIREFRLLSANAEDRGSGTKLAPAFTSQAPQ